MAERLDARREAVHIIAVGPFGRAVAAVLQELVNAQVTCPNERNETMPALWPLARVHVLTSWRPVPNLYQLCDKVSYAWKLPWFPVVLEDQLLRIGPVVVPGKGACHGCYERRFMQHSARQAIYQALNEHYRTHPESGPQGYLPAIAEIAALRAAQLIDQVESEPTSEAGWLWQMDILTRRTMRSRVIGVHDCPRCGLQRDPLTRSYAALRAELEAWLPWPGVQAESAIQGNGGEASSCPQVVNSRELELHSRGGKA